MVIYCGGGGVGIGYGGENVCYVFWFVVIVVVFLVIYCFKKYFCNFDDLSGIVIRKKCWVLFLIWYFWILEENFLRFLVYDLFVIVCIEKEYILCIIYIGWVIYDLCFYF